MRKFVQSRFLIICCSCLLTDCNTASPEKYFDIAVLNCNMMMGFANDGMQRELDQPPVKLAEGSKDKTVSLERKEVIDGKIQFLEENLEKLKQLKETADTKELLQASLALHEYVLPVYKTGYLQLAKLYDGEAPKESIHSTVQAIHDKYFFRFDELFNRLTAIGKPYAERHNIKVNWGN
jgi:hypothetical protein